MAPAARLLCAFVLALFALFATSGKGFADPILRPNVSVDGDVISLGDLFDNLPPDRAGKIVGRAPPPGRHMVVNADWLRKAARSGGVSWRPASVFDQSVISRNGVPIPNEMIEREILIALDGQELPGDPMVELAGGTGPLMAPIGSSTDIAVRDIRYDGRQKTFTAVIEAPVSDPDAQRIQVSGRVVSMIDIPILARPVARGEIIRDSDIAWKRVREDSVKRDVLIDAGQIVGMAPRQNLRAGQHVQSNALQRPIAVKRNAQVTIILQSGGMSLSARGRALDQGSVGDVIRVVNNSSKMTIDAVVEGPNLVSVAYGSTPSLAN